MTGCGTSSSRSTATSTCERSLRRSPRWMTRCRAGEHGRPDMKARRTIVNTRAYDQAHLSAEVARLVPVLAAEGRASAKRSQAHRRSDIITTTFCPICGGNKLPRSRRCADCRDSAMRNYSAAARAAGYSGSLGRYGAARSLSVAPPVPVSEATAANSSTTTQHRTRGVGTNRVQPWGRHLLIDGVWIKESDTPEGMERQETDRAAIARLSELGRARRRV